MAFWLLATPYNAYTNAHYEHDGRRGPISGAQLKGWGVNFAHFKFFFPDTERKCRGNVHIQHIYVTST